MLGHDYTKIWDLKTRIRSINPNIVTMPQYFKQIGFETAAVGKIFDFRSVDRGNDSISWTHKYLGLKRTQKEYVNETERVSYEVLYTHDSTTVDGKVASRSNNFLRKFAKEKKPFFLATRNSKVTYRYPLQGRTQRRSKYGAKRPKK